MLEGIGSVRALAAWRDVPVDIEARFVTAEEKPLLSK